MDTNPSWRRSGQAPPTSCQLQTSSVMEPSFSDSQSFEVFHDSWAHHSRNASRGDISRGGNVSRGDISRGGNVSRGGIVSGALGQKKKGAFVVVDSTAGKNVLGERRLVE